MGALVPSRPGAVVPGGPLRVLTLPALGLALPPNGLGLALRLGGPALCPGSGLLPGAPAPLRDHRSASMSRKAQAASNHAHLSGHGLLECTTRVECVVQILAIGRRCWGAVVQVLVGQRRANSLKIDMDSIGDDRACHQSSESNEERLKTRILRVRWVRGGAAGAPGVNKTIPVGVGRRRAQHGANAGAEHDSGWCSQRVGIRRKRRQTRRHVSRTVRRVAELCRQIGLVNLASHSSRRLLN